MKYKKIFKMWHFWLIVIFWGLRASYLDGIEFYNTSLIFILFINFAFAFFVISIIYSIGYSIYEKSK